MKPLDWILVLFALGNVLVVFLRIWYLHELPLNLDNPLVIRFVCKEFIKYIALWICVPLVLVVWRVWG